METSEFDATLGGTEHLPFSVNSLKFAASRSVEITAMTESILRPSKTKLIFQCLPVHMRRRVMSHNCKRLPKKLREGHLEQLKKSGLPPKQKRPSRKYRRRPGNLLEEYNRRQKRYVWLETHIWHAKRFHMKERWGHRLAYAPCDKAFRACYRASSAHCLLQDISYFTPILITGTVEAIKEIFENVTSPICGLGICAKAYVSGRIQGSLYLYKPNSYPFGFIGKIEFIWTVGNISTQLWLFVHPSQVQEVEVVLSAQLTNKSEDIEQAAKRLKLCNNKQNIQIKLMPGTFNRFRLTGPNSHAVLVHSLKCIDNVEKIQSNEWISGLTNTEMNIKEKEEFWKIISLASSPSQLTPNMIVGLVVRDPRLSRPTYRTKARYQNSKIIDVKTLVNIPPTAAYSPIWDITTHEAIKVNRLTNTQFIEHITKTQLVPGEVNIEDPALQSVPVVLVQRPGSQNPRFKKLGYGSGWDIIVPSGYGLPFWQTFIMFGARAGGLRETESLAFESGECFFPPDSNSGKEEEKRIELELKDRYFKLPPSKRVNHVKLAINTPFICPWRILLQDWCNSSIVNLFVLRDRLTLDKLQESILAKKKLPDIENSASCLVAVYLQIARKGNLKKHALICLPEPEDFKSSKCIIEPHHEDPNEELRKRKRREHAKMRKSLRRRRIKMKKRKEVNKKTHTTEPSDYVKTMRELWLPSNVTTVRNSCTRQVMGYLSQGAFSFSQAQSCGVGYITYNALKILLERGHNQFLVRNTTSRHYRFANFQIIKAV